jgi:transcriptional regulator with XRE-family HTH domain
MHQKDFATLVGISASMIGHVEAGSRSISVEVVEKISDRLNLSPADRDALRRARERKSAETSTTAVPAAEYEALRAEVRRLAEVVEALQRERREGR